MRDGRPPMKLTQDQRATHHTCHQAKLTIRTRGMMALLDGHGIQRQISIMEMAIIPPANPKLVVETQDPLDKLYAKDMFSAFLWSMVYSMDHSEVSRKLKATIQPSHATDTESWRNFTLRHHKFSLLVQSIAELGLWMERDVWLSLIPPLCATDNLPGLDAVIQMAQDKAVKLEKVFLLDKAGSSYRWLFDMGMQSLPTSHLHLKSAAILWRCHKRLSEYHCPDTRELYHSKGYGPQNELTKTWQRLQVQQQREGKVVRRSDSDNSSTSIIDYGVSRRNLCTNARLSKIM